MMILYTVVFFSKYKDVDNEWGLKKVLLELSTSGKYPAKRETHIAPRSIRDPLWKANYLKGKTEITLHIIILPSKSKCKYE